MTTLTPTQLWTRFLERDKEAIQEMNNWMHGSVTESRRLQFVEGRLQDICLVVGELIKQLEEKAQ